MVNASTGVGRGLLRICRGPAIAFRRWFLCFRRPTASFRTLTIDIPAVSFVNPAATKPFREVTAVVPKVTMGFRVLTVVIPAATMAFRTLTIAIPAVTKPFRVLTMAVPKGATGFPSMRYAVPTLKRAGANLKSANKGQQYLLVVWIRERPYETLTRKC